MNKIKELRKEKGLTLDKLSQITNIAPNTLNQYELGKREPSFEIVKLLADTFNVSIDYMLGRTEENTQEKKSSTKIPVLGTIPAGIPIEAVEEVVDYEEISEDMATRGEFFALKVKGDSMSPLINDGDVVIIKKQDDAESGKICVVMINGFDATLKEIKKEENGLWVLPKNPYSDFSPRFFTNEEINKTPIKVIGVAVEIRRSL
jgi:repressor LexA